MYVVVFHQTCECQVPPLDSSCGRNVLCLPSMLSLAVWLALAYSILTNVLWAEPALGSQSSWCSFVLALGFFDAGHRPRALHMQVFNHWDPPPVPAYIIWLCSWSFHSHLQKDIPQVATSTRRIRNVQVSPDHLQSCPACVCRSDPGTWE